MGTSQDCPCRDDLIDPDPIAFVTTAISILSALISLPGAIGEIERRQATRVSAREEQLTLRRNILKQILEKLRAAHEAVVDLRHAVGRFSEEGRALGLEQNIGVGVTKLDLNRHELNEVAELHGALASANQIIFSACSNYLSTTSYSHASIDKELATRLTDVGVNLNKIFSGECTLRDALYLVEDCMHQVRQALEELRRGQNR